MTLLLLAFLVALLLGAALFRVLRTDDWLTDAPTAPCAEAHPSFIAEAIFSPRDWLFIRQESSSDLNLIFLHQRRALAIHWLQDCLTAIRAVRANHLRQSRHSQDLNVLAEVRLLLLFFYFSVLCRCLLFAVHFVQPSVPGSIALYLQTLASKVLPSAPRAVAFSSIREVSRESLG